MRSAPGRGARWLTEACVVSVGGITGLAAAHRAVELARERSAELELTLVESRDRLGGTIATERAGGFLVEAGPTRFSRRSRALALCRRLGDRHPLVRTDDLQEGLRLARRAPARAAGRLSAPGTDEARAVRQVQPVLVAG
jgi:oxygen-dependent protoporphyrinogen oxidase